MYAIGCHKHADGMYAIQLVNGRPFCPADPDPDVVDIEVIAHGLAHQCRFAGQCSEFYSVAQHSVLVSEQLDSQHAMWGLLHDASEGLGLVDLPRPVKVMLPEYSVMENRVMRSVARVFGLPWPVPPEVKAADQAVLAAERRQLMAYGECQWTGLPEPAAVTVRPWSSRKAKETFLDKYQWLNRHLTGN